MSQYMKLAAVRDISEITWKPCQQLSVWEVFEDTKGNLCEMTLVQPRYRQSFVGIIKQVYCKQGCLSYNVEKNTQS